MLKQYPVAHEYKLVRLRECVLSTAVLDHPDPAADYWRQHIVTHPFYNPDVECCVALMLNTRRRVTGHNLVSTGTLDTCLVHPREVFRVAIVNNASAIILMHNHPSGDPTPSEADIRITREIMRAGQTVKIELLDHIIIGGDKRSSLRELGYFY
jgi:DNA repair protein RadC